MSRRARIRALLAGLCLATLAPGAPLGDNTVKLSPSLLKLPQNIGPLRYQGENRYSDRRMGRSFGYNASGLSLNIFVYDYGVRDLPDGPDSVDACEQFESAKDEIEHGGNYQNVQLRSENSRRLSPGTELTAREAVYHFERNGLSAVSVLWLTAADGFFVKLRLSMRTEIGDELDDAREQILGSIAEAIEARPRPVKPLAAAPAEFSFETTTGTEPADAPLWLAYAAEIGAYAQEHPEIVPPCGGLAVAPFAVELAARRTALREYRSRPASARRSAYFDALSRVDDAGFLDEYTWRLLHQDSWGATPPHELAMGAFEEFVAREMPAHVAQSGVRVRIRAVRVLPSPSSH
ncbi:MAG TPA: hypothetical protein VMF52_11770 [Steroidobacteraceae bacterium]|nr:hypothetical protein [Steroidobacteraceae bacterium]